MKNKESTHKKIQIFNYSWKCKRTGNLWLRSLAKSNNLLSQLAAAFSDVDYSLIYPCFPHLFSHQTHPLQSLKFATYIPPHRERQACSTCGTIISHCNSSVLGVASYVAHTYEGWSGSWLVITLSFFWSGSA